MDSLDRSRFHHQGPSAPPRRPGRHDLLVGLAGVAGGAVIDALPILPADDPFRGTLAVLPPVVAGLLVIQRWAQRRYGRRTAKGCPLVEASALVVLLLLVAGRGHLGLRHSPAVVDGLLAGAFVLLLACRSARTLLALRPALGSRLKAALSPAFFFFPLVCYAAVLPWSAERRPPNGDEPYYLLIAHSLAYDFDAELANNYAAGDSLRFMDRRIEPQLKDPTSPDGRTYSRHGVLLPLVLSPFYRLGGKTGAMVAMAALTAAVGFWTLKVARHYAPGEPGAALLAYGLLVFSPPLILYSYQFWTEVPAALLVLFGIDSVQRLEDSRGRARAAWLGLAAAVALLPLLKMRFGLCAAGLVLLAGWRLARSRRRASLILGLAAVLVVAAGALLLYNAHTYGHLLRTHRWDEITTLHRRQPSQWALGAVGLFFDPAFGLAGNAPIWLLLIPAGILCLLARRRLVVDFALTFGLYLLALLPRPGWYGEWSPPFRYGLVMLPLASLALVPLLARRHRLLVRYAATALAILTAVLTVLWLVRPNWTYNFAHGRSHLLDHLAVRLGADVARFFPSAVRVRPATWIWPVALVLVLGAIWLVRRRARAGVLAPAACSVLLLSAALPVAAHRRPTSVVELEDPQVVHAGGELHPHLWQRVRVRYRRGWKLDPGDHLVAPVVPGGDRVSIELAVRRDGASDERSLLVLYADGRVVARRGVPQRSGWTRLRTDPLDWGRARELKIALKATANATVGSSAVLDQVRLRWR